VPTYMAFSTATDAAPSVLTERMRILNNGFVGIGTAAPVNKLHIVGAGTIMMLDSGAANTAVTFGLADNGSTKFLFNKTSANNFSFTNQGNLGEVIWSMFGATDDVAIGPSGDGNYRLDVNKSSSSGTLRVFDQTASTGSTLVTITPGAAQTAASTVLSLGGVAKFGGTNTTAAVAGIIGTTCPAVTCTAAYTWVQAVSSDGSTVFFPVWK